MKHSMFGTTEIIIVGIIVVVLFGASKLPQLGKGMGDAIKNFKKGISESEEIEASKDNPKKEETQKK
ncbi:MAG: twin-arginine translocase TatA/TatE family subunit [Planctomycetota bacterium]